jgi:TRAP-type C4-dicarboxylate transport system permease small subunit
MVNGELLAIIEFYTYIRRTLHANTAFCISLCLFVFCIWLAAAGLLLFRQR